MDVATPGELIPAITSIAKTVGLIMDIMLGVDNSAASSITMSTNDTNTTSDDAQDASDDPCLAISPIDKINADKPGVVEYETDIGDSCKIISSNQNLTNS